MAFPSHRSDYGAGRLLLGLIGFDLIGVVLELLRERPGALLAFALLRFESLLAPLLAFLVGADELLESIKHARFLK
mgnify:CR=1 FL=1